MAFAFAKVLNANNYASDSFAVSNLWPIDSDTLGFAYEQVTSLGASYLTTRVYSRKYTISTGALSAEVGVSGAGTYGFFDPAYVGNVDNTVLLCGYSAGGSLNPFIGFTIKESTDAGATWGSAWSGGGSYNNDSLRGLFRDVVTGDVYAVTQSARIGGYKINVHKRTGAGTWSSSLAFTGSNTNYYDLSGYPNQNAMFVNGKALIVGSKQNGTVLALSSTDLSTWVETIVVSFSDGNWRPCKLAKSTDNVIRLMIPNHLNYVPTAPVICFTSDVGVTWTNIGTPPGLYMEDANGAVVGWPYIDGVSFIVDGRARMYAIIEDITNNKVQTYRAWNTQYTSWGHVETAAIATGTSAFNPEDQSQFPSSAIAVGDDLFRVVCAYLSSGPYVQAWLIKAAGAAMAAGGRSGGGGTPKSYSEN